MKKRFIFCLLAAVVIAAVTLACMFTANEKTLGAMQESRLDFLGGVLLAGGFLGGFLHKPKPYRNG